MLKEPTNPEDTEQGITALFHGLIYRLGITQYLFPPSYFAEAIFALTPHEVKRDAFDSLTKRIKEKSSEAEKFPKIAEWIGSIEKRGRSYWGFTNQETQDLERRTDFLGLTFDIQHTDVKPITRLNPGDIWRNLPVVDVDSHGRAIIEKNDKRVPAHTHQYSKNLASAEFIKQTSDETQRGIFNFLVKTRRLGNHPRTLSNWLTHLSMPFYDEKKGLDYRFGSTSQADLEPYLENRGWLWVPEDVDILGRLEKAELPSTEESKTYLIGFHSAVALTRLFLEKRKNPDRRKVIFLPSTEDNEIVMPYRFASQLVSEDKIENPGIIFEAMVMLYGLKRTYAETDEWLLEKKKDVFSEQGTHSYNQGHSTLELILSKRGMNSKELRRILKNEHLALAKRGYQFQGYSIDFDEVPELRCNSVVYSNPRTGNVIYLLYSKTIRLPLVHELDFSQSNTDALFGEDRSISIPQASQINLLANLRKEFKGREYRTPKEYIGKLKLPESLTQQQQKMYSDWLSGLSS